MNIFCQQIQVVICFHIIFQRSIIFLLVIVWQSHVIIKIVRLNLSFSHFSIYLLVWVLQIFKYVTHIFVRCFVLFIFLNSFEIPFNSLVVIFFEFIVDSNIVVARCVFRGNFRAFCVPTNGLIIKFFCSSIDNSNLVESSRISGMKFCDSFKFFYLVIRIFLVPCQDEQCNSICWIELKNFICSFNCLRFLNSFVFIDVSDTLKRSNPIWFHLMNFVVGFYSLFIYSFVTENVCKTYSKLVTLRMHSDHVSVPFYSFLHYVFLGFRSQKR